MLTKSSQDSVESLLSQIHGLAITSSQKFELWVSRNLTLRGQTVTGDIAMAIILDKILGRSYEPDGFMEETGGRIYRYKISL
jgi:hypothetical protein